MQPTNHFNTVTMPIDQAILVTADPHEYVKNVLHKLKLNCLYQPFYFEHTQKLHHYIKDNLLNFVNQFPYIYNGQYTLKLTELANVNCMFAIHLYQTNFRPIELHTFQFNVRLTIEELQTEKLELEKYSGTAEFLHQLNAYIDLLGNFHSEQLDEQLANIQQKYAKL